MKKDLKTQLIEYLLLMILVVFLFITAEMLYRVYAYKKISPYFQVHTTFAVSNDHIKEFDREYGYHYLPNKDVFYLDIADGLPDKIIKTRVNQNGLIGRFVPKEEWDKAKIKILVFGSSFTANPQYGGISWVDYLSENLSKRGITDVAALDYGQDGSGILTMTHLAAGKAKEKKPDIVIIAFIGRDFVVKRSWISEEEAHGLKRMTESLDSPDNPSMGNGGEIIDPKITEDWIEKVQKNKDRNDPVLLDLQQAATESKRPVKNWFLDFSRSYLFYSLLFRDPLYGMQTIKVLNYKDDPTMKNDMGQLKELGIPIVFVHLPEMAEIIQGGYSLSPQKTSLKKSLEKFSTGSFKFVDLLSDMKQRMTKYDYERFPIPDDGHPTPFGAQLYAGYIAQALVDKGIIRK